MIKKGPVAFPLDEYEFFRDALIVGDLPPQPLEALMTFVEEVCSHCLKHFYICIA